MLLLNTRQHLLSIIRKAPGEFLEQVTKAFCDRTNIEQLEHTISLFLHSDS